MQILLFSPKSAASRSGNWTTASRWRKQLESAGHRVKLCTDPGLQQFGNADMLIGLHAKRSAKIVMRFKRLTPDRPALIALTGTDLYRDLPSGRNIATMIRALDACDQIVTLQPLMNRKLFPRWKSKTAVVMMDVPKGTFTRRKFKQGSLKVCVVGHLRKEKDPFRTEMAVRNLPANIASASSTLAVRFRHATVNSHRK